LEAASWPTTFGAGYSAFIFAAASGATDVLEGSLGNDGSVTVMYVTVSQAL
jgi:hypothetical protein